MKNMNQHTLPIVQLPDHVVLFSTEKEIIGLVDYASGSMMQWMARLHIPVLLVHIPAIINPYEDQFPFLAVKSLHKKNQRGSRVCSSRYWRISEDSQLLEPVEV
ncbi:hypothetical protein F2Q68_00040551 [Brassica cretica]|uniref:Uncharacterized protein n=1 Tax=Brassica cretica TaxID=69181 RepID=A0A8S9MKS0_BRACR|nr:hypothetical protein F2Q68_00040551 [Brassica cretica]